MGYHYSSKILILAHTLMCVAELISLEGPSIYQNAYAI